MKKTILSLLLAVTTLSMSAFGNCPKDSAIETENVCKSDGLANYKCENLANDKSAGNVGSLENSLNAVKSGNSKQGKLYIIGGGSRPVSMISQIAHLSGTLSEGYAFILPMSSGEPEEAIQRAKSDFASVGVKHITGFNFTGDYLQKLNNTTSPQHITQALKNTEELQNIMIDSLKGAKLIYIPGGVQSNFMNAIKNTPVAEAIHFAYNNGAVIAGTSAGAAVMSKLMITGNQLNPRPGSGYVTIAENNIEIEEGLGLLKDVIIDQHFIMRQRLNRLVSVAIDYPGILCIGIDESTAIIVDGDLATVAGESQVIVIKNKSGEKIVINGLLGARNMELSVYLPGDSFTLR